MYMSLLLLLIIVPASLPVSAEIWTWTLSAPGDYSFNFHAFPCFTSLSSCRRDMTLHSLWASNSTPTVFGLRKRLGLSVFSLCTFSSSCSEGNSQSLHETHTDQLQYDPAPYQHCWGQKMLHTRELPCAEGSDHQGQRPTLISIQPKQILPQQEATSTSTGVSGLHFCVSHSSPRTCGNWLCLLHWDSKHPPCLLET